MRRREVCPPRAGTVASRFELGRTGFLLFFLPEAPGTRGELGRGLHKGVSSGYSIWPKRWRLQPSPQEGLPPLGRLPPLQA